MYTKAIILASITSSLTTRKPRHTNRGQGRGGNSLSKGGFGRGQPPSQGRRIGGRFGGGKGRRNNPSTGKLTSTSYYGNTPSKVIHEHECLNKPKLNRVYHRVTDTASKLAHSGRLQGIRPSTQPGGVYPYNPTRTSLNMDKSFNTNNNNSNNGNNDITTSARDL